MGRTPLTGCITTGARGRRLGGEHRLIATGPLTWTDTFSNETGFAIDRGTVNKTGNVSWAEIARTGVGVSTFSDGTVTRSKNYVYRVRAYNDAGMSAYSNQASV